MKNFSVAVSSVPQCSIYAPEEYHKAASYLCDYLGKITGAEFSITDTITKPAIIFSAPPLGSSYEYAYQISEDALYIYAPTPVKAGCAVFDLLEKHAGCVWCTSDFEIVPQNKDLTFSFADYGFTPQISYRDVYYRDYNDPIFAMKQRTSHAGFSKADEAPLWGNGSSHTMLNLLGIEKYAQHPEYFCMRDGVRVEPKMTSVYGAETAENLQPCLSNPDVLEIMCENLKKDFEKNPTAPFWSVSMADNMSYCQCPACTKIDEEEESHMGTYIRFVNQVAERFPDKVISTLAYTYTRKPPKKTKPNKNVNILLCNIEAYRDAPIETDPLNRGAKDELTAWAKICGNVYLWDYCIQFKNLVSPFPNLRVLAPNIRFFAQNNVQSLFNQGNRDKGGEFSELRGYMLAKLNSEPFADDRKIMQTFLDAYYGSAAPYILQYIDLMHDALQKSDYNLSIFGDPCEETGSFLSRELFYQYMLLFDKAEAAVKQDSQRLLHVKSARLPLYYAGVKISYGSHEEVCEMLSRFEQIAKETGLEKVEEWTQTVDMFVAEQKKRLQEWK